MKKDLEIRHFPMELRVAGAEGSPVLEGHAAVFNQLSADFGGWRERIKPGAFTEAIQGDVFSLWNHENDLVLGRTQSGTLELVEDETGLAYRVTPPDTTWFRDRLVSLKRKDVTGASFRFYTEADEWTTDGDQKIRTILKIKELVEISPGVTFPAYPQATTEVARRSMEAWIESERARQAAGAGQAPDVVVQNELRRRELRLKEMTL
jgi:Escherichia/Staphylococcus phage prohead protease